MDLAFVGRFVDAPQDQEIEPQPKDGEGILGSEGDLPFHPEKDKIPFIALGFSLAGFLPLGLFAAVLGFGKFGPLEVPAIISMVGMLFAVIGILRAVDWKDAKALRVSTLAGVLSFVRLFLMPFF